MYKMQPRNGNGHGNGHYTIGWAPAPLRPEQLGRPALGQATPFLESPVLALLTDVVVGGASAFYAWGLGLQKNKMSTFWWVVAAASAMKALHDLSRIDGNRR